MTRRYRYVGLALLVAGAAAATWWLWVLYRASDRANAATYWQLVVAVLTGFAAVLVPLIRSARREPDRDADDRVEDQLARAATRRWRHAAEERGLRHPDALTVDWSLAATLGTSITAAVGATAFPVVPGYPAVERRLLVAGGSVRDLHRVFGGLRSGRLIVTGEPGSGKSAAAILLVLDLLGHREAAPEHVRRGIPVPVLVGLAGWDPTVRPVHDWLVRELQQTYDPLFAGRSGGASARRLLDDGRIAVVLDGLDEMPESLARIALDALDRCSGLRMVVTARRAELSAMTGPEVLRGAVPVVLEPVATAAVAAYLAGSRAADPESPWVDLVGRVRSRRGDALTRALGTPLMITLVRDGLRDRSDVQEFLDRCDAPGVTADDLEGHLLDRLVATAYRASTPAPRYDVDTARRTLQWLAARMSADRTTELAWWRIPTWAPRFPRALAVGVLTGLLMFRTNVTGLADPDFFPVVLTVIGALGGLLGARCAASLGHALPIRWNDVLRRPGLVLAAGVALGFLSRGGLYGWLSSGATVLLFLVVVLAGTVSTVRSVRSRADRRAAERLEPAGMFLLGLGLGWAGTELFGRFLDTITYFALLGAVGILSVAVALRLALVPAPGPDPTSPLTPSASWRRRRAAQLVGWSALACAGGALTIAGVSATAQLAGLFGTAGLGLAVLSGAAVGLVFPEPWLTSFACAQLALRHRLPLRLMRFLEDARERGVLRSAGPVYQFRHADLQERLAAQRRSSSAAGVYRPALAELADRVRRRDDADGVATLSWWHIPTLVPAAPRVATVAVLGGGSTWLSFAVLYPGLGSTFVGATVGLAALVGAGVGAARLDRGLRTRSTAPRTLLSAVRSPLLVGLLVGAVFISDLVSVVPPEVMLLLSVGLISGAAFWLGVGLVLRLAHGEAARLRWRRVTQDAGRLSRFLLGVGLGYVVASTAIVSGLTVPREFVLHLVLTLAATAAAARLAVGAQSARPGEDAPTDPVVSWRRQRAAQLVVWLVGGAFVSGFVVRSGLRVLGLIGLPGGVLLHVVAAAVAGLLALGWGVLLGLTFPASWMTSLACVQLHHRAGTPVRLMSLLEEARARGDVEVANTAFVFPDGAEADTA